MACVDWDVDPFDWIDPAVVEPDLPGVRDGHHDVPADKLGPVQPVPVRGRQQPGPVAALLVQPIGALEDGDAGPVRGGRVEGDVVTVDEDLHPVVEPADHQRTHRAEPAGVASGGLEPAQATLYGLADGDRLGDRERDSRVDDDAPRGRFLDRDEAGGRGRELDLDVRRERAEPDPLLRHALGVAVVGRVGLERQPALPPVLALEHR